MKKIFAFVLSAIMICTSFVFGTTATAAEMTDEEMIWFFFKDEGLSDYGVAGLMGNLYAESGLRSNNLQNSFESKLGYSDQGYTDAVDNGTYTLEQFIGDGAGYGLAQWTFATRKKALYNFAKDEGTSISDLKMQLDFLYLELIMSYRSTVWNILLEATDIATASNAVLHDFEKPADQSAPVEQLRISYSQRYYNRYAGKEKPVTTTTGDVNGDGKIGALDASLILQYDAMIITKLEVEAAADVSGDGKIGALDASLILQYDAMIITEFPVNKK